MGQGSSRIALIGAGPSGLALLRAFELMNNGGNIPMIYCFEKQSDWGGKWNYTWQTGLDEHGEPVHSSTYRNLWIDGPKELDEYADYTFDRHFLKPIPSFVPRETFRDYILGRAKNPDVRWHIEFNTVVRSVEYDKDYEAFSLQSENLITGKSCKERFDYVIVAAGHHSVPNIPDFEGIETFPGRILHSHDFRDARQFAGQKILIIGGRLSAENIVLQTYKYGAEAITISYRRKHFDYKWPEKIEEKFLLTKIEGQMVHFPDGSTREFDSIIFCTGYKPHFPFLSEELRLDTENNFYPSQLYKGIFFQERPRLIFLAMQKAIFNSSLFDAQAWYIRLIVFGLISLPTKPERAADIEMWKNRESQIKNPLDIIDFTIAYIKDLVRITKCPIVDLDKARAICKSVFAVKESNILYSRDMCYTSSITGTTAVSYDTPWIDIMDDSAIRFS